jgi:hypothetical protein
MKRIRISSLLKKLLFIGIALACFILGILLIISVFQSGYGYQFDVDELHHANLVYLYLHGYQPYRDIYNSFYTPLFEWLIAPAFMIFGFSFKTITFTRFIMIVLLAIRMIAMYIFVKTVWSRRVALFFIPLFLFDPFLVYSGMQIRSDNLMMTVFSLALAALATKRKHLAALLFGLSLVVFIKILPALAVIALVISYREIRAKRYKTLISMALISLIPLVLFILYGLVIGALPQMYRQIIVEATASYSVFRYPVPYGSFNKPDNVWIYGVMGMPVTWVFVWMLPILGGAGWFHTLNNLMTKKEKPVTVPLKLGMVLLLIVQLIVIFNVSSVFLQHYLLVNWLFALFGAVAVDTLLAGLSPYPVLRYLSVGLVFFIFVALSRASIIYNIDRSTITNTDQNAAIERRWRQIPENEPIFPGYLFRPSVYPVPYGFYIGNVSTLAFTHLPSIADTLDKRQLKHLIIDDYTLGLLPADAQEYITGRYTRVTGDNELMTRNP